MGLNRIEVDFGSLRNLCFGDEEKEWFIGEMMLHNQILNLDQNVESSDSALTSGYNKLAVFQSLPSGPRLSLCFPNSSPINSDFRSSLKYNQG